LQKQGLFYFVKNNQCFHTI